MKTLGLGSDLVAAILQGGWETCVSYCLAWAILVEPSRDAGRKCEGGPCPETQT